MTGVGLSSLLGSVKASKQQVDYGTWRGRVRDTNIRIETQEDMFRVINHAVRMPLSDLRIQTGMPVFVDNHGHLTAITAALNPETVTRIIEWFSQRANISYQIGTGSDFDCAFTIPDLTDTDEAGLEIKHRFRLNITGCLSDGTTSGIRLAARYISQTIPTKERVRLEPEIVENATPQQGGVIFLGEVGSGKTSSGAAIMREIAEGRTSVRGYVLSYEAPCEYAFETLPSDCVVFGQTEIPIHLRDFPSGARNSLRCKPNFCYLGEMRDRETIEGAAELIITGVPLLTTAHANRVSVGFTRLIQKFPVPQQPQAFYSLIANTHMLVNQRIVRHADWSEDNQKMICLREWQILTDEIRVRLEDAGPERHGRVLQEIIDSPSNKYGRSMRETVRRFYQAGEITQATAHRMLSAYGYLPADL